MGRDGGSTGVGAEALGSGRRRLGDRPRLERARERVPDHAMDRSNDAIRVGSSRERPRVRRAKAAAAAAADGRNEPRADRTAQLQSKQRRAVRQHKRGEQHRVGLFRAVARDNGVRCGVVLLRARRGGQRFRHQPAAAAAPAPGGTAATCDIRLAAALGVAARVCGKLGEIVLVELVLLHHLVAHPRSPARCECLPLHAGLIHEQPKQLTATDRTVVVHILGRAVQRLDRRVLLLGGAGLLLAVARGIAATVGRVLLPGGAGLLLAVARGIAATVGRGRRRRRHPPISPSAQCTIPDGFMPRVVDLLEGRVDLAGPRRRLQLSLSLSL